MSALELFASDSFSVRTVTIDGEPWFVAADVCRNLGIPAAVKEVAALQVRQAVARIRELGPPF